MTDRSRFTSLPKLPALDFSQYYKANADLTNQVKLLHVPLQSDTAYFRSFRQIVEENAKMLNQQPSTEQSSFLNQTIKVELDHNKKIKQLFEQTLYKCKSEHQEKQYLDRKRQSQLISSIQKQVRHYPLKMTPYSQELPLSKETSGTTSRRRITFITFLSGSFWYRLEQMWHPSVREMSMATTHQSNAYIFGGFGTKVLGDLLQYDMIAHKFTELQQLQDIPQRRYGHCLHAIPYQINIAYQYSLENPQSQPLMGRNLILFGGELHFNAELKLRENLSDTRIYNVETGIWTVLKPNLEHIPDSRKCFGSCFVGKGLLIHGGFKSRSQCLDDLYYLNLTQCKWKPLETSRTPFTAGLGYQQLLCIYQRPAALLDKKEFRSKPLKLQDYEGIYCLGGCYLDKERTTSYYKNFLAILKLDTHPPMWVIPETTGIEPKGRILHSATYLSELSIIAVFGGRDDNMSNPYFGSLHVYKILEKQWSTFEMWGEPQKTRAAHVAFCHKSRLMILGGVNMEGYLEGGVQVCELNPTEVRQLQQECMPVMSADNVVKQVNTQPTSLDQRIQFTASPQPFKGYLPTKGSRRKIEIKQLSFQNFTSHLS